MGRESSLGAEQYIRMQPSKTLDMSSTSKFLFPVCATRVVVVRRKGAYAHVILHFVL
jgi:hypothetical protein